ncbi:PucR family transcriptional regulator, partial [Streptomyces sp. NY05-11A]|nr:PucR family transcriptional regulator [Streptomyces sp. NY05-11A]
MKELAGRLTALDPDAGAAVQVIAYFDRLAESRAGVEALVRGAAVLAGVPARLVDADRRVRIRVEADGARRDTDLPPDPAWPSTGLTPDGAPALWLERTGAVPSVVDAVILERAAGAARLVLDRTRGRAPLDDPALVETLLDATAAESARLHAARRLGLDPAAPARALATPGGRPR